MKIAVGVSMKKLSSMVTIAENNFECVILKVKKNQFTNLIGLGCFNGNETMFRLTKGRNHTCTVWSGTENDNYSWYWGESGYTLVSDKLDMQGAVIQNCIQNEFGIYIGSDPVKISQTLFKKKPSPKEKIYVAMWWGNEGIVVHRDNEFWKGFKSIECFENFIKDNNGTVEQVGEVYKSPHTGCNMLNFNVKM